MNCSFCKNKAVYLRKNEGNYYCEKHLSNSIEKRIKKTISDNKLVQKGDTIAVAFSGGKDSSNTLFLLNKIFKPNPHIKLFAITIDEGIKGYRDKSLKKSEKFCEDLGIDQHIFSFKQEFGLTVDQLSKKMKSGFCGTCGLLRRYVLNKKARELKATKLATGHNLDDECQSIVMNTLKGDLLRLARGGSIPHLAKHSRFVPRIKPLVMIPERESAMFGMINNIDAYHGECPYAMDNSLRGETREFLNRLEQSSPGIKYSLFESAQKIIPSIKTKFKGEKIGVCKKCREPTSQEICRVCEILISTG